MHSPVPELRKRLKKALSSHFWLIFGTMQAGREGKGRVANLLAECEQHASTSAQRPQQTLGTLLSQALQETSIRSLAGQQADQVGPQVAQWEKNPPDSAGDGRDTASVPGSGSSPGERNGNALQYSCLGNPMDRGAWWATVHSVARSKISLSIAHTS